MSSDDEPVVPTQFLSNKQYNFLKYFTQIFLPAVGALYFGIAQIWGFPNSQGVNGTINLVIAFLGIMLGLSTQRYNNSGRYDGTINVVEQPNKNVLDFQFADPHTILDKKEIVLRVNKD